MKDSWRSFFRRLVVTTVISGSVAWTSAMYYAAQLAFDSADDPVYADGWQDGDNGGTGFTPWDFSSSITWQGTYYGQYTDSTFHAIDDGLQAGTHYSNPFNNIGRAWDIGNSPTRNGVPRAGRGFAPLQIGQTLKVTIDNPTDQQFFRGYFVRLNGGTGGTDGNICYGDYACTYGAELPVKKMLFSRFEYFSNGEWTIEDAASTATGVFDTDTAAAGALLSVKRTGDATYDVVLDPLGPGPSFTASQAFANPAFDVDWIEFTFFNTETDTGTPPAFATDLYIRSIEIVDDSAAGVPGDYNNDLKVDAADYTVWRDHLNQTYQLNNEVAGVTPGQVTTEDYTAWKTRFGNSGSGAGAIAAGGAVPEPGTMFGLAASFVLCVGLRIRGGKPSDNDREKKIRP